MLEALIAGLGQILSWPAIGLMVVGVAIGFAVGILPGIGGASALALMLPFIFKMAPQEAFAFLLGMAAVVAMAGEITSILFGVPGEPITAATVIDGHTMAKQGKAGRALGAALFAALSGGILGGLSLIATVLIIEPFFTKFGSPEFLMFSLMGIAFVSSLTGRSPVKGFIAAGLGLLLSQVGQAPGSATLRYTFDQLLLWDGVPIVPATLGLFAVPELLDMAIHRTPIARRGVTDISGLGEGFLDVLRHRWLALRCALIGVVVGIAPGIGGSGAQWVAYGHAVQSAGDPKRFGKGAVEGVIAPSIAAGAERGGALIPTVVFGIPGSVNTAVLLGAFIILGLVPGRQMLTTYLDVTFGMAWTTILANVFTFVIALLFARQLVALTRVRAGLMVPPLLVLVFLGAYTGRNTIFDIVLALAFGVLGVAMVELDWPRAPLILGLVLGDKIEGYLMLSVERYGLDFLGRPLVLILLIVSVAVALSPYLRPLVRHWRERASARASAA